MVSQDSPSNPASDMLHQFIISDSISSQNQFENQNFDGYSPQLGGSSSFHQSLGLLRTIQSFEERMPRPIDLVQAPSVAQESNISHTRHLMDLLGATNEANNPAQRLSLSLGSHLLVPEIQYRQRPFNLDPSFFSPGEEARDASNPRVDQLNSDYSFTGSAFPSSSASLNRSSSTSYGAESFPTSILSSRYLKPTVLLLQEIVNVNDKVVDISSDELVGKLVRGGQRGAFGLSSALRAELCSNGPLPPEKHELHVKFAKLVSLLEELEDRFEKYYHQMEDVITSFEEIAGAGAAKVYTALALQAMSKHFCNLRDAIVSQIRAIRRKVSQDSPKLSIGLSQLSLLDRENRNTRISLQQLGIVQSQRQAWRPIRGLPETSVTILRSWLFEHFLHPYPNDSEKLMLASQTGLTKNQVSNWFINARVRLWKPMIEEMYKEEFADSSDDSNQLPSSGSRTKETTTDHSED
ncbi:hypothetical protein Tsubulata_035326 [Turnera subulata]|uniref:Homeobox domain-containing protein n=1 Tax=Turnera subulata TaxID=218843 RepID=A0A9Q0FYV8_9ROSI|nr:hypothetical protein Tsubulata_035326 [Turnera subulata]